MCLIAIAIDWFDDYPIVVAANRDEFHQRPTAALARWEDHSHVIAGRDLQAGGTWLGLSSHGRLAMLTNVRGQKAAPPNAPSRGQLVLDYLLHEGDTTHWVDDLALKQDHYAGFNLVVGELGQTQWLISSDGTLEPLTEGVHAISNGLPGEDWPKTRGLRDDMCAIGDASDHNALFALLEDTAPAEDAELPDTGVDHATERWLSSRRIVGTDYGTRASTVLRYHRDGYVDLIERTRNASGEVCGERIERVQLFG